MGRGLSDLAKFNDRNTVLEGKINLPKVKMDIAQMRYLLSLYDSKEDSVVAPPEALRATLKQLAEYGSTWKAKFEKLNQELKKGSETVHTASDNNAHSMYNRALYIRPPPAADHPLLTLCPLNPKLDIAHIENDYNVKGVVIIDDLLRSEVIKELRSFALESTIWSDVKDTYQGAYWNAGFTHPLIGHVQAALRNKFSFIRPWHLTNTWSYAYDNEEDQLKMSNENQGIFIHADEARVNCNVWMTPDASNLAPKRGGLIVWPRKPPADWSFDEYNAMRSPGAKQKVMKFVATVTPVKIGYKFNRATFFDSDFFHRSDRSKFKAGHANRRINFTFLFGEMSKERIGVHERKSIK